MWLSSLFCVTTIFVILPNLVLAEMLLLGFVASASEASRFTLGNTARRIRNRDRADASK
jgi:hypothetical protein